MLAAGAAKRHSELEKHCYGNLNNWVRQVQETILVKNEEAIEHRFRTKVK